MVIKTSEIDPSFINKMISLGGESLKKCFQCGTCTVVCPLSPEKETFPRRLMLYAQLGLKNKLLQDPSIWVCANCSDCSVECPRGARPGDVMAALRKYSTATHTMQGLASRLTSSWWIPIPLLALPTILLAALLLFLGRFHIPSGPILFPKLIPELYVDAGGMVLGALVVIGLLYNVVKFRSWISSNTSDNPKNTTINNTAKSFISTILSDVIGQRMLRVCGGSRLRWIAHLTIFLGFAGAALTTTLIFVIGQGGEPLPLDNPVKILGNLSAALLLFGTTYAIIRRLMGDDRVGKSTLYDWLFLLTLFTVTLSGIATEVFRLIELPIPAYLGYGLHLVLAFFLIAFAPYTKFAHAFYRPLAAWGERIRGRL